MTWDEFIANAKTVVSTKAAPYGAMFDAHGWRSLAPITHTFSTNVYTPAGLFDFTSDAAVNALEIMKRMKEVAPKNMLEAGKTDGGVNTTPDEDAFAARQAAYYVKYQNAPMRFAATWPDPKLLHIAGLPKASERRRHRVLDHGRGLFKYGAEQAAGRRLHEVPDLATCASGSTRSARTSGAHPASSRRTSPSGAKWTKNPPSWIADWAFTVSQAARDEQGDPDAQVRADPVRDRPAGLGEVPEGRREEPEEGAREGEGPRAAEVKKTVVVAIPTPGAVFPPRARRPGGGQ